MCKYVAAFCVGLVFLFLLQSERSVGATVFRGRRAKRGYHVFPWQRHGVIKPSQQRRKSMITPSVRATVAVHFLISTLIIISLPRQQAVSRCPQTAMLMFPPASYYFFSPFERRWLSYRSLLIQSPLLFSQTPTGRPLRTLMETPSPLPAYTS